MPPLQGSRPRLPLPLHMQIVLTNTVPAVSSRLFRVSSYVQVQIGPAVLLKLAASLLAFSVLSLLC